MLKRVGKEIWSKSGMQVGVIALLCAMVLALIPATANAQIYTGTVTGVVTDTTGAVVAGADVTVTSVATGATYKATTSDSGVFSVPQLPVGTYEVKIGQKGFKEFVAKNVEVHTSTVTELNAQLQLGSASETVTVEASDVQVQTTSAAVGNVIEGTQVRELPLNGENFMGLVTLTPGVSQANSFNSRDKGLTGGADFSVNGNPYNYNLFLVDGVNNNDVGSGRTILVYPSVDTIAEFNMITNSYGPEYGQAAGSIISITTKSGTNQFHGGVFYAGRNDALNANDWFSNNNGTGKAKLSRNDYGYNLSGPIIKNKLFGWWNQEWNKETRGVSEVSCVPTLAERNGDFSQGLSCGAPAPVIPKAFQYQDPTTHVYNPLRIANPDPAGVALMNFYPLPNRSNANNWALQESQKPDWSEWNVRVDYDINKKNRATFRYTNDSWTSPGPNPGLFWGDSIFPTVNSDWSQPSKSVLGKLSTQIGTSMVNDVEFGYGHNAIITTFSPGSKAIVQSINAAVPTAWPSSLKTLPSLPQVGGWGGPNPYGNGQNYWTIAPYANHEDLYALQDNLSKVAGNHTWKFGAYYSSNAKIENNNGGTDQPVFGVDNGSVAIGTNNQLANLLIPGASGDTPGQIFKNVGENSKNQVARVIWHDFEWYVGDTYKWRRNVTLTYGFRWSFLREPYSESNEWASFSLKYYDPNRPAADACNGVIVVPGTNPCGAQASYLASLGIPLPLSGGVAGPNRALVNNNNHAIAPRLGVAWDPFGNGKMAVRAGVGQFFQREPVGIDERLAGTAPFVINAQSTRTLESATALTNPSVSPSASKDPRAIVPNSWQWNISVEREIVKDMALQVGYVGNTGIHLTSMLDLNAVPYSDWTQTAFLSGGSLNAFRPAGHFGQIGQFARYGHANYNSLQVLYRWKQSNMSQFQAAYTWSHSIANVELDNSSGSVNQQAITNQLNPGLDRGNTNINRPQIFVANEVFYFPKLTNKNGFVRNTLGGWELNSIITISSGASLSVFTSGAGGYNSAPFTDGQGNTIGPCSATDIASGTCVLGSNSALNSLQGSGFNNNNRANRTNVSCNSGSNGAQILNQNAFTLVGYTIGTTGNAARGICTGPTYRNIDMQLAKNWYFGERFRLKFAMDFFNLFNHANFNGGNLEGSGWSGSNLICGSIVPGNGTIANPDHYLPCSPTNNVVSQQVGVSVHNPNVGNPHASFGQVNSVKPGRELQYSIRFYF